jgi:hypothetical protein
LRVGRRRSTSRPRLYFPFVFSLFAFMFIKTGGGKGREEKPHQAPRARGRRPGLPWRRGGGRRVRSVVISEVYRYRR